VSKTVQFKMPTKTIPATPDSWVQTRAPAMDSEMGRVQATPEPAAPAEPMKRFTIDVTEALHKRIKAQCAMRGVKMADVMREMLEREFPA
jgi:hypothetical protein